MTHNPHYKEGGLFGRHGFLGLQGKEREQIRITNYSGSPVDIFFCEQDTQYKGAQVAFTILQQIQSLAPKQSLVTQKPPYKGLRAPARYLIAQAFMRNTSAKIYYISLESDRDEVVLYADGFKANRAINPVQEGGTSANGGAFWNSKPVNPNLYVRNKVIIGQNRPHIQVALGYGVESGYFLNDSAMGTLSLYNSGNAVFNPLLADQEFNFIRPKSEGLFSGKKRRMFVIIQNMRYEPIKFVILDLENDKEDIAIYFSATVFSKTGHVYNNPPAPVVSSRNVQKPVQQQFVQSAPVQPKKPTLSNVPPSPPPEPTATMASILQGPIAAVMQAPAAIVSAVAAPLAPSPNAAPAAPMAPQYPQPKNPLFSNLAASSATTYSKAQTNPNVVSEYKKPNPNVLSDADIQSALKAQIKQGTALKKTAVQAPAASLAPNDQTAFGKTKERLAADPKFTAAMLARRNAIKDEDEEDEDEDDWKEGGKGYRYGGRYSGSLKPKVIFVRF